MKFILAYLKKYRFVIAAVMLIKLGGTIGELLIPYILEFLIDDIVPKQDLIAVAVWGVVMVVIAITARQLNAAANRLSVKVAQKSTYEIRRDLFWKTMNLSGNQLDEFGLPSLISRMTSDSYNLQSFIQLVQSLGIRAPIMLLGGIVITMTMDVGLASILCIMAPVLIVIVIYISIKGIPLYDKVQQSMDNIVRIMRENIVGIRVVKSLSKEEYEKKHFENANEQMMRNDVKAGIVMAMPGPIMTLFLNVGLTLVVIVGADRVNRGVTQPGVILAFLTYFNMILMGVMAINRVFMLMSKASASARRIAAVVQKEEELAVIPKEQVAQSCRNGYIVFEHVDFSYGNVDSSQNSSYFVGMRREKCLSDIDFTIKKGGSMGIIGATGCGKTTIVNLLMRFYDADSGHIFIAGRDVRTYEKDELRQMFGVVFQNDAVIADTISENISFGRELENNEIRRAAFNAGAQEFIESYEDAYAHRAVIHGANFSGGQKQRLLISRALAADPKILVLDDSSSALDYKTDAALRKAIRQEYKDAATIIVAQRISSIMNLDDILVLEEGRIIGHGTHEELMQNCKMYQEIYRTQMGEV